MEEDGPWVWAEAKGKAKECWAGPSRCWTHKQSGALLVLLWAAEIPHATWTLYLWGLATCASYAS